MRQYKKILIVNVFFDDFRRTTGCPLRVPSGSGHLFLAGAFNPATTEVKVYSEQTEGYLLDPNLLGWPDMLVLTGLTSGLDRMFHLAAYAKTLNPAVVTVAGGPPVRALPHFSAGYFDHVCVGDVEELREVAVAHWGEDVVQPRGDLFPRFDLARPGTRVGYVESSRYCNFRCAFCSLTAEGRHYHKYDVDHVRRQIEATGKRQIVFLDNNFYGNDRNYFLERVEMLSDLRRRGTIDGWSALVAGDFFAREANIELIARAGCLAIFTGVESFDSAQLAAHNKKQNKTLQQVDTIRNCLEHGILFQYGIMLDPSSRRIADLEQEIEFILSTPELPFPAYFTLPIPLPGTPYFHDCNARGLILPELGLREFVGVSLLLRPLDELDAAIGFARRIASLRGWRPQVLRHMARFSVRYRRRLTAFQHLIAATNAVVAMLPGVATSPLKPQRHFSPLTFYGPTESPDPAYRPVISVDPAFEHHFHPTMITDRAGQITAELEEDLLPNGTDLRSRAYG